MFFILRSGSASDSAGFLSDSAGSDSVSDSAVDCYFWQPSKCTSCIEVDNILHNFNLIYTYL